MRKPQAVALAVALLGVMLYAGAAWLDLAPGGWTLRSLFVDPRAEAAAEYREHRDARLAGFRRERVPPGAVVFLGSSTIERFPLESCFPGRPVLNRGIAQEPFAELQSRWRESVPADAAALVLYTASVDLREARAPLERIDAGLRELLAALRRERPQTALCLLGLLPEREMSADRKAELARWDERLARRANEMDASFVATARAPLAAADGGLAEAFSSDRLHLNAEGYLVLSRWILAEGGRAGELLAP